MLRFSGPHDVPAGPLLTRLGNLASHSPWRRAGEGGSAGKPNAKIYVTCSSVVLLVETFLYIIEVLKYLKYFWGKLASLNLDLEGNKYTNI